MSASTACSASAAARTARRNNVRVAPLHALVPARSDLLSAYNAFVSTIVAPEESQPTFEEACTELLRFYALKAAASADADADCVILSPGAGVDALWHAHLLSTRAYADFCAKYTLNGTLLHHRPSGEHDPPVMRAARALRTLIAYKAAFGVAALPHPATLWGFVDYQDQQQQQQQPPAAPSVAVGSASMQTDDAFVSINVKTLTQELFTVLVRPALDTVGHLKELIRQLRNHELDSQRIIYNGKELDNSRKLSDYDIGAASTVHLVLRLRAC